MKTKLFKLFGLLFYLFLVCIIKTFAQNSIPNGITITHNGNNYNIDFVLPDYYFDTITVTEADSTTEKFIDIKVNDEFGAIDTIGLPSLPHLTFMFAIPFESSLPNIIVQDTEVANQIIGKRIYPFQEPISTDSASTQPLFFINDNYYDSSGINYNPVVITDEFIVSGLKGIRITIFPFNYNPSLNKLTVRKHINFEVQLISQITSHTAESLFLDSFLENLFVNYDPSPRSVIKGNYLIITAPEYENTLTYFANYKRNIGYNVVVVNTAITGNTKEDIKDYIQKRYDNESTRPIFVLLVGDTDKIPYWIGDNHKKPKTDLYYATLEGNDRIADVFIGRFSVRTNNYFTDIEQLQNIIYIKT